MQLDKKLYDEINEYCKLNNLKTRDFVHNLLKDAFLKEKYGDTPFYNYKKDILLETYEENIKSGNENEILEERKTTTGAELSSIQPIETYEKIIVSDDIIKIDEFTPIETVEAKPQPKKTRKLK
jgi:hypothetical protein